MSSSGFEDPVSHPGAVIDAQGADTAAHTEDASYTAVGDSTSSTVGPSGGVKLTGHPLEAGESAPPAAFATNATATPNYLEGTQNSVDVSRHQQSDAHEVSPHHYDFAHTADHHGYIDALEEPSMTEDECNEIDLIRQDNEVLKSVIRRSKDASALNTQVHANIKLQSAYEGKCRELKKETQLRKQNESLLAETRSKHQSSFNAKSAEAKKYFDLTLSLRTELDILKEKSREQEVLIAILRKENVRLNTICKDNNINVSNFPEGSPNKPNVVVTKSLLTMSPTNFRKEVLKVNATTSVLNAASASTVKRRSVSPVNPEALHASGSYTARSISPGGMSQSGNGFATPIPHPFLEIGQRVSWKGMQGCVRFIGAVEPLGGDLWVGLELQEGRGEHSGLAFGKRYFTAPARSSVFVLPSELGVSRKAGFESSNVSTGRSRSPQQQLASPGRTPETPKSSSPKFKSSTASKAVAPAPVAAKKRTTQIKRVSPQRASHVNDANASQVNAAGEKTDLIEIPTAGASSPSTPVQPAAASFGADPETFSENDSADVHASPADDAQLGSLGDEY